MTKQKTKEQEMKEGILTDVEKLRELTKNTGNKKVEEWRKDLIEENPEGFRFWMAKHKIEGYLEANPLGFGIIEIQNNLEKSFKGTIRSALKNGYEMDKHYVIVDWVFFHQLLKEAEKSKGGSKHGKF